MVTISTEIKKKLEKYIKELEKDSVRIEKAYLFGSYANGTFNEWSDIDVALISKDFSGERFFDKDRIRKAKFKVDTNISPLPYRPEDFNESDLFVKEILETGIRIK